MTRYRGFSGEVAPLEGLGIIRRNGYGDRLAYRRSLISNGTISPRLTTTTTTAPTSTVPGRDAQGLALPGWFESYCVPGSSVRKIVNGISTCPMYFRGVPTTEVADRAIQELMEPVTPGDQEIEKRQYAEGGDGRAELLEKQAKIDEAIKRATDDRVTTPTVPAPEAATPEMPALLPLAIGAALILLMR